MKRQVVRVPVTYKDRWDDGFGAKGWKLDCSISEPSVIATTAETGLRIPTSVLVHDILDHHLCGVGIGGHRNEAIALIQLSIRTGADPRLDYAQIVKEDLMQGQINGETMWSFLPEDLRRQIPPENNHIETPIPFLRQKLGDNALQERLVEHFVEIGQAAQAEAERKFRATGLDYTRRTEIGFCLQEVLRQADQAVCEAGIKEVPAVFWIGSNRCGVNIGESFVEEFSAIIMKKGRKAEEGIDEQKSEKK